MRQQRTLGNEKKKYLDRVSGKVHDEVSRVRVVDHGDVAEKVEQVVNHSLDVFGIRQRGAQVPN